MQDRSHLEKTLEVAKCRAPAWAISFGSMLHVGLGAGQMFVSPLYQLHEGGNKVVFAPAQATYAML